MNKQKMFGTSILILVVLLFVTTSVVFASNPYNGMMQSDPDISENIEERPFWGRMHGRSRGWASADEFQPMKSEMVEAIAEETGLTVEEIENRLINGERLFNIATVAGMTEGEYFNLMIALRQDFIDNALEEGLITDVQYNWMQERLNTVQDGEGFGLCDHQNNEFSPMHGYGRAGRRGRW